MDALYCVKLRGLLQTNAHWASVVMTSVVTVSETDTET